MAITRAQQARQMLKDAGFVVQDGFKNYIKDSESITVPKEFKARSNAPATKLAYITADEAKMLKKEKPGTPHKGPKGIPSYDAFDAQGNFRSGEEMSAAERGDRDAFGRDPGARDAARDVRAGAVAAGARESKQEKRDRDFQKRKAEIRKASAARRRKAQRDITRQERLEARKNRKFMKSLLNRDLLKRQERLKGIFSGATSFSFVDPITGKTVTEALNPGGLTDTELAELASVSGITGIGPKTELQQSILNNLLEKSDKFSGAEMEAFKEKFNVADIPGPSALGLGLKLFEPLLKKGSRKTKDFFTDDVLPSGKFKYKGQVVTPELFAFLSPTEMQEVYGDYMGRRQRDEIDAFGNPKIQRDESGPDLRPIPLIPQKAAATAPLTPAVARNLGGLSPRIAGSIFDFTGLADGGRVSAMDGGIMDLVREEMFLGGIVKGIKKGIKGATRAIKKVAKSPFGKAALGFAALKFGVPFLKEKGLGKFFLKDAAEGFSLANLSDKGVFAGIAGLSALAGLTAPKEDEDKFDIDAYYKTSGLDPNPDLFPRILGSQFVESAADGGRIGYADAGGVISEKEKKKLAKSPLYKGFKKMYSVDPSMARDNKSYKEKLKIFEDMYKKGFQKGGDVEPVAKKTMPLLDMGGKEMDLRDNGGFVPIGRMEKADDVPARLSKTEFVFTAEAVRNAGDGDVDKGAEVMYNMMKNLEDGGNVSEESQGLEGARRMFQTSKRLEEVL